MRSEYSNQSKIKMSKATPDVQLRASMLLPSKKLQFQKKTKTVQEIIAQVIKDLGMDSPRRKYGRMMKGGKELSFPSVKTLK